MHTYIHTYTHTYIHTYTYIYISLSLYIYIYIYLERENKTLRMEISGGNLFLSSLLYGIIDFQSWIISNFVGLLALGIHHWNDTNYCLQRYHYQEVIFIFYIADAFPFTNLK